MINKLTALLLFLCFTQLSFSQIGDVPDSTDITVNDSLETPLGSPFESYYQPLSYDEAQAAYGRINTNGKITDYTKVPNNREINDSRIADPHFMLTDEGKDTLDKILKLVEKETGYQMAVVCLNSIGDEDPTTFAHDVFNLWGIGDADLDNGFLCLVVNDIHRVEFANGYGTEIVLSDLQGEDIRQNEMIPYFKENDYTTGVIRGMQAVADVFYGAPPVYTSESNYESTPIIEEVETPSRPFIEHPVVKVYIKLVVVATSLWILFLLIALFTKNLHKRYHRLKIFTLLFFPIFMPVPFLLIYFLNKKLMEKWRNTERFSPKTGEFMIKLSEADDDEFLKKGQVAEEVIKSIDYDVWVTVDKSDFIVLAYKRWFSKFRKCPKCKFTTWFKEYDRVISAATYSSSGTGQRKYSCKNCSHSKITTYTIPRKVESSSSSGGSSYGGSSGGSSYSSSSSSGSSYGGGSSGGGGGGSSW